MKLPDDPKTPSFIHKFQWIRNPLEFMDNCSQRYGDCFTVQLAFKPWVFFSNPQAIKEIFTSNLGQFDSGDRSISTTLLLATTVLVLSSHVDLLRDLLLAHCQMLLLS